MQSILANPKRKMRGFDVMKEKIYTIPVNEAFDEGDGCPFCRLMHGLEEQRCAYTLGASMMEPDARAVTNALGFCEKHFKMIFEQPNKLSLALVLETHLEEVRGKMRLAGAALVREDIKKGGIFKKKNTASGDTLCTAIASAVSDCAVCRHVKSTMERYFDVFFYMWDKDTQFMAKFDNCSGVCLPHYRELLQKSGQYLKEERAKQFAADLYTKQCTLFDTLQEDIHKFTLKFDYRNKDMPWDSAKDAPKRVIEYLSGAKLDKGDGDDE